MFLQSYTVGMVSTNCYLLGDETTHLGAVIDPGDQGELLCGLLRQAGYTPALVLLTHGHFDHVDGVRDFLHASGPVPVCIHSADYPHCPTGFFGAGAAEGLGKLEGVRLVAEGDTLSLGELTIHVLETPGHTGGGVTYQVGDTLFTGDTLFAGSCGRTDFANSDPNAMLASLAKLAALPGDWQVCPGHGPKTTLERERRYNPYLRQAAGR